MMKRSLIARLAGVVAMVAGGCLAIAPAPAVAAIGPPATINNGTVELGIQPEGNLIVGGRGLAFLPTGHESLAPGCACEGWGVGDVGSGVTGFASESNGQGNVTVVDFASTASTAASVVRVPSTPVAGSPEFRVTHTFEPSPATPFMYRLNVRIENSSAVGATDLRYRRVMDWDIEPTAFNEFVTNEPGSAVNLIHLSNDGFFTPNPLEPNTPATNEVDIYREGRTVDYGPNDHGSLWDFSFGPLAAGATKSFTILYGAAPTEDDALGALAAVNAEAFSLGQPNDAGHPILTDSSNPIRPRGDIDGAPTTFIFAFEGVGGKPVFSGKARPYALVAADGGSFAPGGEGFVGTASIRPGDPIDRNPDGTIKGPSGRALTSPVVGVAYTTDRKGAWLAQADGNVIEIGTAPDLGDVKGIPLEKPIVGVTSTADGKGIYLVGSDGGIFALGTAPFRGSLPALGLPPQAPVVGMSLDPDGSGYVTAGRDGGVFAFDTPFAGSAFGITEHPITGIAADLDGRGYLLSATDGGVFAFDAAFKGSAVGLRLEGPVIGIAANPYGPGYWMAGADGGVFAFGGAPFTGSVADIVLNAPIVGIVAL